MTYEEVLAKQIHESMDERRQLNDPIKQSNNSFAEYLKQNFNGQVAEIEENIRKEQEKSKFRKFLDKLIKIL